MNDRNSKIKIEKIFTNGVGMYINRMKLLRPLSDKGHKIKYICEIIHNKVVFGL